LAIAVPLSRLAPRIWHGSAFFVRPLRDFMIIERLATTGAGISFIGIGLTMRKRQNKSWRVFVFGGIALLVLVIVSIVFGLSM
jgi:hypothetical protein